LTTNESAAIMGEYLPDSQLAIPFANLFKVSDQVKFGGLSPNLELISQDLDLAEHLVREIESEFEARRERGLDAE
jgi:hypothetical protein